MNKIELASLNEIEECYEIICDGREFQKEQGFVQWTENYPNRETILEDIKKRKGYVIKIGDDIAGYMCIDFSGEPVYENIKGKWRSEVPYAVVHRMAFCKKYRGKGLANIAFQLIDELCIKNNVRCIRLDTDFSNLRMQHILKKNGFVECGIIVFQGGDKLAFDKILSDN